METTASEKFRTARAGGTLIPQGANQASSSNCSEGLNNKGKEIIHHVMGTERAGEADTMRYALSLCLLDEYKVLKNCFFFEHCNRSIPDFNVYWLKFNRAL